MLNPPPETRTSLDRVAVALATVMGAGRAKFAPGTVGTLATIPLYLLLAWTGSSWWYIGTTLALLAAGIVAAQHVARLAGDADPGMVVVDESVGFLVTMTFVSPTLAHIALGFVLFRALDVVKPLGIRRLESMEGGFGIMLDDFVAGVYANVLVRLLIEAVG